MVDNLEIRVNGIPIPLDERVEVFLNSEHYDVQYIMTCINDYEKRKARQRRYSKRLRDNNKNK